MFASTRRTQLVATATGLLVVCAALVVVQRSGGGGAALSLLSHHGGQNKELEDVSLKVRKVPGSGYQASNVEGLRATALLAQAKATASKGMKELEASSAAHLAAEEKSALLHKAIDNKQRSLSIVDADEHEANASEEHAAKSLLKAKLAIKTVARSAVTAEHANLEAQADNSEAIDTETKARANFELAIQDAIDERKSAEGIVDTEKNIAHLENHVKDLKHNLMWKGSWEPFHGGAHDAHFKGGRGRSTLARRRHASHQSKMGALGDKIVHAHVGEPLVH